MKKGPLDDVFEAKRRFAEQVKQSGLTLEEYIKRERPKLLAIIGRDETTTINGINYPQNHPRVKNQGTNSNIK